MKIKKPSALFVGKEMNVEKREYKVGDFVKYNENGEMETVVMVDPEFKYGEKPLYLVGVAGKPNTYTRMTMEYISEYANK